MVFYESVCLLLYFNQIFMKTQVNQPDNPTELDQLLASNPEFSEAHRQRNIKIPLEMCEQGRALLKQKKYLEASKSFSKSVMAFEFLLKNNLLSTQEVKQMFTQIMIPTYSNLSLCHLKMQSYESVISFCNQILTNDSSNIKAKYRRGLAEQKLKKFDEAIQDFISVGQLDPSMKIQCEALIRGCKADIRKQSQKEKKMASSFLSNIKDQRSMSEEITHQNSNIQPAHGGISQKIKDLGRCIKQLCKKMSKKFT